MGILISQSPQSAFQPAIEFPEVATITILSNLFLLSRREYISPLEISPLSFP
jgi:hypothetical protein